MPYRFAVALAALSASACTMTDAAPEGTPIQIERESITYSTEPCFGTCPVYSVTVMPEGEGVFEGKQHVATTGTQSFRIDAATYRRFADHLAAVRPREDDRNISHGDPDCGNAPTDMPSITVRWASNTGAADQNLRLYLGCRSTEADRVAGVLKAAPDLLPIAAYIGKSDVGKR